MSHSETNFGIKAILTIYKPSFFLKGLKLSLPISLLVSFILFYNDLYSPEVVASISNKVLSISVGLLGFVLGGYALIIGFADVKYIALKKDKTSRHSLFQKLSAIFSICLVMLIFLSIYSFSISTIAEYNLPFVFRGDIFYRVFNGIIIFTLFFGAIYTILMAKDLIINIFNFSQIRQLYIDKEDIEDE